MVSTVDVVLIQTVLPDYRRPVVGVLVERLGERFEAFCGATYFDSSIRTHAYDTRHVRPLRNHFLARRRLLWQHGAIQASRRASVVIVEANPRVLTTWVVLVLRRLEGRTTLAWGHAWSRGGRHAATGHIRGWFQRLATRYVAYTAAQARELQAALPGISVGVAPNALYRAADMTPSLETPGSAATFLYVGRLVPEKRVSELIDAFGKAHARLPAGSRLVIVGDGPCRPELQREAAGMGDAIQFLGHVSDQDVLRAVHGSAIATVSPGTAGLSIIQSLGFGVPVIVSAHGAHGPELAAAEDGWNALFYDGTVPGALEQALLKIADQREMWAARRQAISNRCRSEYSVEALVEGLLSAAGIA